jgi:hypothetical protein
MSEEENLYAKIREIDFVGDTRSEVIIRWTLRVVAALIISGIVLTGLALLTDAK